MSSPINRKPDSIANAIRMKRSQDPKMVLILEGRTDERIFENFIDQNKCKIELAYGKNNVLQVLENLNNSSFTGFLGIVDADEWYLTGKMPNMENLLITEYHDIECIILSSDLFRRFIKEYALNSKLKKFHPNIYEKLLESALPLGYLRGFSITDELNLNFENCYKLEEFEKLINTKSLDIDVNALINLIEEWSPSPTIKDKKKLANKISNHIKEKRVNPILICHGFDVICILAIGLINIFGNDLRGKTVCPQCLDGMLRLSYTFSDFQSSHLFAEIKKWETQNSSFKVFIKN